MTELNSCPHCIVLDKVSGEEGNTFANKELEAFSSQCPLVQCILKRALDTSGVYLVRCKNDPSQTVVAARSGVDSWSLSYERDEETYLLSSKKIFNILNIIAENALSEVGTQRDLGQSLVNTDDKSEISAVTRRVITRFSDLLEQDLELMLGKPEIENIDNQVVEEGYTKGSQKYNEVRKRYIARKWIEANSSPNPELMFDDRWYFTLENKERVVSEEWKGDSLMKVFNDRDYRMGELTVEEINYLLTNENEFGDIGRGIFYETLDNKNANRVIGFLLDEFNIDRESVETYYCGGKHVNEDSIRNFRFSGNILILQNGQGNIVGFGNFVRSGSNIYEISIYLSKIQRSKGIGTLCLMKLIDQIKRIKAKGAEIQTLKTNRAAQKIFRKVAADLGLDVDERDDEENESIINLSVKF